MFWRSGTERSEGAQKYAAAVFIPLFYGARPPRAAPSAFCLRCRRHFVVFNCGCCRFLCFLTRVYTFLDADDAEFRQKVANFLFCADRIDHKSRPEKSETATEKVNFWAKMQYRWWPKLLTFSPSPFPPFESEKKGGIGRYSVRGIFAILANVVAIFGRSF